MGIVTNQAFIFTYWQITRVFSTLKYCICDHRALVELI